MGAAALALQPAVAHARFRPALDHDYRYVETATRDDGTGERQYRVTRRIHFARDRDGYRAEVTTVSLQQDPQNPDAARFERGMGAELGRVVRVRLDAQGRLLTVDGLSEIWSDFAGRVAGMLPADADASAALVAPLRAADDATKRAMVASVIMPVIAAADADRTAGVRSVTRRARAPAPATLVLHGSEATAVTRDGAVDIRLHADGTLPALADEDAITVICDDHRVIDPTTGLLRWSRDRTRLSLGTSPHARASLDETTIEITAW